MLETESGRLPELTFDIGPIRPPSEGRDRSLLLRLTRGCPWNKCTFCTSYKECLFELRPPAEVLSDINTIHRLTRELLSISGQDQPGKSINDAVVAEYLQRNRLLFNERLSGPELVAHRWQCLSVVAGWLASGGRTVFLQDADSLVMPINQILDILKALREQFPFVERITSYARARTVSRQSLSKLCDLKAAGLSRLHLGLESGSDRVLLNVQKGLTADLQIKAGQLVRQSGISLSEYVMPGLGGSELSRTHAEETARVLNKVKPDFIRFRSLVLKPGMRLYDVMTENKFKLATEDQMVDEIHQMVSALDFPVIIASDHMSNLLGEVEGVLPEDRNRVLAVIDAYRAHPHIGRQMIQVSRRLGSYMAVSGGLVPSLENEATNALASIRAGQLCDENTLTILMAKLKQVYI